jgi:hypothetical protein
MTGQRIRDKKICYNCNSEETYVTKDGRILWHRWIDHIYCHYCYMRLFINPRNNGRTNKKPKPVGYKIKHRIHSLRRIQFRTGRIIVDRNPRVGVCNLCRAVLPFDCRRTNMHHEEYYAEDVMKGALEICPSCHMKITQPWLK